VKVYVASSWRNRGGQQAAVQTFRAAGMEVYDFTDEEGFHWSSVGGKNWELASTETYLEMLNHPLAEAGFKSDMDALRSADATVLVAPCGRSAHLELGYAIGAGQKTAIWIPTIQEPELMYKMADFVTDSLFDLLGFLGVKD
jgi:hypothetical protein